MATLAFYPAEVRHAIAGQYFEDNRVELYNLRQARHATSPPQKRETAERAFASNRSIGARRVWRCHAAAE
jgi:hypothetical protein